MCHKLKWSIWAQVSIFTFQVTIFRSLFKKNFEILAIFSNHFIYFFLFIFWEEKENGRKKNIIIQFTDEKKSWADCNETYATFPLSIKQRSAPIWRFWSVYSHGLCDELHNSQSCGYFDSEMNLDKYYFMKFPND